MTDKEKIRAEVKRRREIHRKAKRIESAFEDNAILSYIDSMQEEPKKCMYSKDDYTDEDRKVLCDGCEEECECSKSDDFTIALAECIHQAQGSVTDPMVFAELWKDELIKLAKSEEPVSEDLEEAAKHYLYSNILYDDVYVGNPTDKDCIEMFKAGAQWQKQKDESCSKDLGDYINELSKQFPEVSFAKLSRIAVRVAKWQKEKDKDKVLTEEQCRKIRDDAFELGKDAMKQQLMKDTVEGEIVKDIANNLYIGKAQVNKNNFKFGEKVQIIVLKEE